MSAFIPEITEWAIEEGIDILSPEWQTFIRNRQSNYEDINDAFTSVTSLGASLDAIRLEWNHLTNPSTTRAGTPYQPSLLNIPGTYYV